MTPEEVVIASNGLVRPNQDRGADTRSQRAILTADSSVAGFPFQAYFYFDVEGALNLIALKLDPNASCRELDFALRSTYGPPDEMGSLGPKWWDRKNDNVVMYTYLGSNHCRVRYLPFSEPGVLGGL